MEGFQVAKYQLKIKAGNRGLSFPPFKGSTFRGGFGTVFKRVVCSQRDTDCLVCLLKNTCPYAYIFETFPPPGAEALRKFNSIPRPFVIEPPLEQQTEYPPGAVLDFSLVLIGKAIQYFPYFLVVFRELGSVGIGRGRKPYVLTEVKALNDLTGRIETVYSASDETIHNVDLIIWGSNIDAEGKTDGAKKTDLIIEYETVTRVKYAEKFVSTIEFHVLVRNLLRRLSSLYYFHHDRELILDFNELIEKAKTISIFFDQTQWVDWERYSNRQKTRMNLGGVQGKVCYRGDWQEFWPLLKLGELVHVGKATTFGMGKYRIISD